MTEPPVDPLDSLLEEFVGQAEGDPGGLPALSTWLQRVPDGREEEFLARASWYLGMHDAGAGEPEEVRRQIGRYEVEVLLSRRQYSLVYRAYDPELRRSVALKILPGDAALRGAQRLRREARVLARLRHPRLIQVHDVGVDGDDAFLVIEFVPGPDFTAVPAAELDAELSWAMQVAEALAYLHEQGVVHRDVKPSNILLRPDGTAALTDFGLVREMDVESTLTGATLGTPQYMAPELALDPSQAGAAADVYGLGVSFVERLSGCVPHAGRNLPQVFAAVASGHAPFPRRVIHGLAGPGAQALLACLAADPARRPSAAELVSALREGSRIDRSHPPSSRRRVVAVGLLGLLLAVWLGWVFAAGPAPSGTGDPGGDVLARAVALLFDPGDLESVQESEAGFGEGLSPIAAAMLGPARSPWATRRQAELGALLPALGSDPDARLVRACHALRVAPPPPIAEVVGLLGPVAETTAGLVIRAEAYRRAGQIEDAQSMGNLALGKVPRNGGDRFFSALLRLSRAERGLIAPGAMVGLGDIENTGVWHGWACLLRVALQRLRGAPAGDYREALQQAQTRLGEAFLPAWFGRVVTGGERDLRDNLVNCMDLRARFGPVGCIEDQLLTVAAPYSRALTLRAWETYEQSGRRRYALEDAVLLGVVWHGLWSGGDAREEAMRAFLLSRLRVARVWSGLAVARLTGQLPDSDPAFWRLRGAATPRDPVEILLLRLHRVLRGGPRVSVLDALLERWWRGDRSQQDLLGQAVALHQERLCLSLAASRGKLGRALGFLALQGRVRALSEALALADPLTSAQRAILSKAGPAPAEQLVAELLLAGYRAGIPPVAPRDASALSRVQEAFSVPVIAVSRLAPQRLGERLEKLSAAAPMQARLAACLTAGWLAAHLPGSGLPGPQRSLRRAREIAGPQWTADAAASWTGFLLGGR